VNTRFYFHLAKGEQRLFDRFGVELLREEVTTQAALAVAKEIWPGVSNTEGWAGWSIEVVDSDGRVVRVVALVD
jgi:hypothetical protein